MARPAFVLLAALALTAAACGADPDTTSDEQNVAVDTEADLAWQQYLANLELAKSYQPRCAPPLAGDDPSETAVQRPRVLVTGYGRFLSTTRNATGEMVAQLLDELDYPLTDPPAPDTVDPPEPQTRAALGTMVLPNIGEVDVCAMVLPVFWDLAAVLVLKELQAFNPDFVLMNGIAGYRQPIWLELGSLNRAKALSDGSGILTPVASGTPLVPSAPEDETARANLLSWTSVRDAARESIATQAADELRGERFARALDGALLAGYPRSSNTYLCNNVTYTVGYLMDHPGETVRLMEASHVREGFEGALDVALDGDFSSTPRVFVHWPSALLDDGLLPMGAEVMRSIIDSQLSASFGEGGEPPTRGDNALADLPGDPAGDTY